MMKKYPTANIICNSDDLKPFPLRSVTRQGCPLLSLVFHAVNSAVGMLDRVIRQEKRIVGIQIQMEKVMQGMVAHVYNPIGSGG